MSGRVLPYYQDVDGYRIPGIFSAEAYKTGLKYKPRPDDLFIPTFPKCGTTWVQQIVTLIFNKGKPVTDFLEFNSRTPFLELSGAEGVERMKRPGSIKTHLPFYMTPYSPDAKYIYIVRNPKDALVSFYHHTRSYLYKFEEGDFNDYFEVFINGQNDFGEYFDHVMSWYEHRNDPNVLFIFYEALRKDTSKGIKEIGQFMGPEYGKMLEDEAVMADVLLYSGMEYMKKILNDDIESISRSAESIRDDAPAGLKHFMKNLTEFRSANTKPFELIRKGIVGGWRQNFSEDQNRRMDQKLEEKMGKTDLYKFWQSIKCI